MRCGLLVVLGAAAGFGVAAMADVSREGGRVNQAVKQEEATFPLLIDHIRNAAASGVWQKDGWRDPIIDGAIHEWAHQAADLTGQARPNLPAGLAGLKPAQAMQGKLTGTLYVGAGNASLNFLEKSVILVDGNAKIGFAWDCVIVARGAVYIAHGDRNVVMAGQYIHVSHDGNHKQGQLQGSLLMSGDALDISHASGSVCAAPTMVRIGHANGVTFADSPNIDAGQGLNAANRRIDGLKLRAAPAPAQNPLAAKLQVVQAVKGNDSGTGAMAVVKHDGAELLVRAGEQVKDGNGKQSPL